MDNPEFVTIRTYGFVHEAAIAREMLEAEGIAVLLPDEHTMSVDPGLQNVIGGVKLQVRVEDAERATDILDTIVA